MIKKQIPIIFISLTVLLLIAVSCATEDGAEDSSPLSGVMGEIGDLNIVMPQGMAIASNTETYTADNSNSQNYEVKLNKIQSVLKATRLIDCDNAIPPLNQSPAKPVCYGPSINYTNHPDYVSGVPPADGTLPPGDLGLWTETEGGSNQACAVAQLNYLIASVSLRVDTALAMEAMMICSARITGKKLPKEGETLDLESPVTLLGGDQLSIDSALIKRANDTTNGRRVYISRLTGKYYTTKNAQQKENPFSLTLKHLPSSKAYPTENGLLKMIITNQGDSSNDVVLSVLYAKSDDDLNYRMVSAQFVPVAPDQKNTTYFEAAGSTYQNQVKSQPSSLTIADTTGHDGWINDYNLLVANISSTTGAGRLTYSWQAGNKDGYTRTLNVKTEASNLGAAYFGFAQNPTVGGDYGPTLLNGMFCNWAGPGASKQITAKVQKQAIQRDNTGVWGLTQSWITYAPTTSCDWNDVSENSATFEGLTFPLTNNLLPLEQYKTEFVPLTLPDSIVDE